MAYELADGHWSCHYVLLMLFMLVRNRNFGDGFAVGDNVPWPRARLREPGHWRSLSTFPEQAA